MKRYTKSLVAVLLSIFLIIGSILPILAATQPSSYSKNYNSGQRDVICTSLNGTSAPSYYTGNYTYDNLSTLSESSLYSSLQTLMRSTHKYISSYDDCHYKANRTDCQNGDESVSLIYTSYSATMSQWNGWNREHVWPKSLGGNSTTGGGADMHHIRPSDAVVNSTRSNKKYGYAATGKAVYGSNPASGYLGGHSSTYYEPLDNVKGDVARICLYVYVRWGSDWGATDITKVFQSVDVLLEWCELDPVDTWEMGRNEVIQNIQGNRNVFIDYPELAWVLFDEEIPDDMVTPSGEAMSGTSTTPTQKPSEAPTETPTEKPVIPPPTTPNGTLEDPLTVSQILIANSDLANDESSDEVFYVKGKVVAIGQTGSYYKDVYITDGIDDFLIYTINMGSGISGFKVGDTIVARGYVKNYYGKIEMATKYINGVANYVMCVKILDDDAITETPTEPPTEKPTETPSEPPTEKPTETPPTPCAHENTVISGAKPSCTEDGYSGDKVCADCGELLVVGTVFPVSGHSFGEPEVIVPATESSSGISKSVCEDCGEEKLDSIPKLESSDDTPEDPTESPSTESPSTDSKPNDSETPPPDQTDAGCDSTVSISLIGLVTAIAAGFVLTKKKR